MSLSYNPSCSVPFLRYIILITKFVFFILNVRISSCLERLSERAIRLDSPFCNDAQADLLRWAETFVQRRGHPFCIDFFGNSIYDDKRTLSDILR